jgi:hypothetical protein
MQISTIINESALPLSLARAASQEAVVLKRRIAMGVRNGDTDMVGKLEVMYHNALEYRDTMMALARQKAKGKRRLGWFCVAVGMIHAGAALGIVGRVKGWW